MLSIILFMSSVLNFTASTANAGGFVGYHCIHEEGDESNFWISDDNSIIQYPDTSSEWPLILNSDCNLSSTFTQDARFNQHACYDVFTDTWDQQGNHGYTRIILNDAILSKQQTGLMGFQVFMGGMGSTYSSILKCNKI